jgi:hypothetical protein
MLGASILCSLNDVRQAHRGCLDFLFDLSVFLRWPGMWSLLMAAEHERHDRRQCSYQAQPHNARSHHESGRLHVHMISIDLCCPKVYSAAYQHPYSHPWSRLTRILTARAPLPIWQGARPKTSHTRVEFLASGILGMDVGIGQRRPV